MLLMVFHNIPEKPRQSRTSQCGIYGNLRNDGAAVWGKIGYTFTGDLIVEGHRLVDHRRTGMAEVAGILNLFMIPASYRDRFPE